MSARLTIDREDIPERFTSLWRARLCRAAFLMCVAAASAAQRPNVLMIVSTTKATRPLAARQPAPSHAEPRPARPERRALRPLLRQLRLRPDPAALLTGRWPLCTGCHGVTHNRETVRSEEVTLAEALADAGYRTAASASGTTANMLP
jgi:hypothetical protein